MVRDMKPVNAVETPCVNVCLLDSESGLCAGCGRTLEEIANWSSMTDAERRAVMAALPARLADRNTAESRPT
jgi:hypothetical protein